MRSRVPVFRRDFILAEIALNLSVSASLASIFNFKTTLDDDKNGDDDEDDKYQNLPPIESTG